MIHFIFAKKNSKTTWRLFFNISDPSINGHLHYPNDIDRSLNESVTDKLEKIVLIIITISFIPVIPSTSGSLHNEFVSLLFLQTHRETDRIFEPSGVHLPTHDRDHFHFHHVVFSLQLKSKIGNILTKASVLRIILNIDECM